ncbi:DUF6049 family protein [Streptomyces sp. TS71-3]|uniref:DUF6049 family protein n=1 Tax=Streptomyces sp. TS71-3 TaxID=2733862 RepID=UPI001B263377|nr:DUF6049 family protein [Streptomyces sp. TS71-3]GHJ40242.1 hypothetical protein Sm713_58510 [Streptomyces sp. TS71-3]
MAEAADMQGTSASVARRWLWRTGALLAGAPLVVGMTLHSSTPAAAGTQADASRGTAGRVATQAEPIGSGTVDVALNALTPAAPREGDTLKVSGMLTNKSHHTITGASLALRTGPTLDGRSAIEGVSRHAAFGTVPEGTPIDGKYSMTVAKLAPGAPLPFTLSVPISKLHLDSDGVYQLGVTLTGQTTEQPWQQVLGVQRTVLPWQPESATPKTKTTYLWPLISSTHLTAETGSDEQQTPVFHDDELAKEIGPGGRLQQMVALGSKLNVTWVIDPDLLASADAMTRSYRIQQPNGTTKPGTNQAVAKQWLNDLEKTVADQKVVALPFGDPDLASLAHTGKNVSGSLSHLQDATDVASTTVETVLHVKPDTGFAWPAEGAVDPSIIDVATSAGAHAVIARSDSFRETGGLPYTPTAARPIGGGTTAVVADAGLSKAFQGDMTRAETSTLAVQDFLAQSLMIRQQAPHTQRSIVVAPQRMPSASQAQTMAQAVAALQSSGWSQPQGLAAAADAKPDPGATTRVPSPHSYPRALRDQQIPVDAFTSIADTERNLDHFKGVLTDSSRVITPFGRAMDREMSTSWRGHDADAQSFREGVSSYLGGLSDGVHLIEKSDTKLSGRSATIPVTVQNNLVQGADHLTLRLTSKRPTRLKIGNGAYSEQPVKVSGGHSQSVKFTTTANANGPVPVTAQLYTEDGQLYGPPVTFDVDVTEVTATVMLVIAGGVLLLVLAGFRMYTQRKREAARQAAERGPEDDADAAEVPEEESDDDASPVSGSGEATAPAQDAAETVGTGGRGPGASGSGASAGSGAPAGDDAPGTGAQRGGTASGRLQESGVAASGQASDPVPDTAPGTTGPSGTGERVDR